MPAPEVSVIIPSHNRAHLLGRAIESVLAQDFANLEAIVIDDGSSDNSPQVAEQYAREDSRVRVFAQENAGVSAARNAGVANARGEFIAFQDDDDISHPQRIGKQVALLRSRPENAACFCNFALISPSSMRIKPRRWERLCQAFSRGRKNSALRMALPSLMIKREAYLALGGFLSYFPTCEDADFLLRFKERFEYDLIGDVLYFYQTYAPGKGKSLTNTRTALFSFRYIAAGLVSAHMRRNGLPDPVADGVPANDILPRMSELPASLRLRLLRVIRNAGRQLLARGEGSADNMRRVREHIDALGGGECERQARRYRRWLAWQCLRYGNVGALRLFFPSHGASAVISRGNASQQ